MNHPVCSFPGTICGVRFRRLRRVGHYALKGLLNHREKDVTGGYVQIDVERLREPMQRIEDFVLKSAGVKAGKSATR
jgi:hypothetical protein